MTHLRPRAPCRLWKDKGTVRENYANLGLAAAVNADAAVAVDVHTWRGMLKGRKTSKLALGTGQLQVASSGILIEESMDVEITTREANAAQSEMDDIVAHAAEPRLFMFEGEQEFVEALMKKYGKEDFRRMAMDMKLNPYQVLSRIISASNTHLCASPAELGACH